jgi:NDP-sugar pyrophosphorylase family protein
MIKQAVILAGGEGKRLFPITKNLPKPMAPINDIPFLSYLIFILKKKGIKKILILVGYKSEKIIEYFKNNKSIDVSFNYSSTKTNTGKRVLNAYDHLDKNFLLIYGDNYWIPNLKKMYQKFKSKNALISTTVFNNKKGTAEYGRENNVHTNKNSLVENYDKSRKDINLNGVDIGFFIINKKFLDTFEKKNKNYSLENDFLIEAIKLNKLIAYKTDIQYYSITNIQMLKKFEKVAKNKKFGFI